MPIAKEITKELEAEILSLYNNGTSLDRILQKTRIPIPRIRALLCRHGVHIRTNREAIKLYQETKAKRRYNNDRFNY